MSIVEKAIGKLRRTAEPPGTPEPLPSPSERLVATATASARPAPVRPRVALDFAALREGGLVPPEAEGGRLATEFRRVKRPLVDRALAPSSADRPNRNVIMIASAAPGDGKTFTSLNLALSLSMERDLSVLLVDADVPKRHLSTALGIEAAPGLLDALSDPGLDLETIVHDTDVPGLAVLGAGRHMPIATELLASQRLQDLIQRLNAVDPRRVIVFDSPPLLATTEANGVAAACGQVVLVVRAGATPRSAVAAALGQIGEGKDVGLVLNGAEPRRGDAYYGYGYYGVYGGKPAGT